MLLLHETDGAKPYALTHVVHSFVRYCSYNCQKAAWSTHKTVCATGAAFKESLERPDNWQNKKLNDDFTKWLNYYRRLICTFSAVPAFNLANSPPDKLATHCMYLVIEHQPEARDVPFFFKMINGQIITREEMVETLQSMNLTDGQVDEWAQDNRGDHTVHIVIQFEGMLRFLWFSLRDLSRWRTINPATSNMLAGQWAEALAGAIETGYTGPKSGGD
ncbi:hypothetical protein DAEQUDRAFT_64230 [Daedalea quercina L-15889]|uniref:MYND-type domain-containing protein n=1 Tax=Daedalea quercina L-15889 TaxID=1314783 RepID=A0A165SN12_9APHY|nr:hypothetical protein DAEQUDRAFT_64230 [Daedalea quercina L-15889]